ncbi:hypothetical protein LEN26_010616 [Aphanomyces euteiches]|nr:hypothetical protein LEN26_010616 [Aphanomyces euteiches]
MEAKEITGNAKTVTCPVTGETWVVRKTDVELRVFRENLSAFRATRALHPIVDWLLQCLVDIPFASDADSTPQDVFGRLLTFLLHVRMVVWESSDDLTTTDSTLAMFSTILNTFVANHKSIPIDDLTCSHLDHTPCLFPKNTKKRLRKRLFCTHLLEIFIASGLGRSKSAIRNSRHSIPLLFMPIMS